VPRNRTARVAVLGSPVQRSATSGSSSTRSNAVRRRVVVGLLIAGSLVLLTVSFRSTALDGVQGAGASVLRPFEIAAHRVAAPFRDATTWTRGLFRAKSENRKLTREVEELRREVAGLAAARQANAYLERLLKYERSPAFPQDYNAVAAQVLTSPTVFDRSVTISAGSNRGIVVQDVVVTADGLVGQVTKVFGNVSRVMLITDPDSGVRAVDEREQAAIGNPPARQFRRHALAHIGRQGQEGREGRHDRHRRLAGRRQAAVDLPGDTSRSASSRSPARTRQTSSSRSRWSRSPSFPRCSRCSCSCPNPRSLRRSID